MQLSVLGQTLSYRLHKKAKPVKTPGTLSGASFQNAAFQQPEKAVMVYATDDIISNFQIENLIAETAGNTKGTVKNWKVTKRPT